VLKGLYPEEVRLTGAKSLFYTGVPTIGSWGGINKPTKAIVQKIRHPENHGTGQYRTCWHKHAPDKQHNNEIYRASYCMHPPYGSGD